MRGGRHLRALLADEIRARRVLDRRCARRARWRHALERRAQLPGAQFHARRDARGRRRAVLSLELRRAGDRRDRRDRFAALPGCQPVRAQQPLLRSEGEQALPPLGLRRRARAQEDPAVAACRAASAKAARANVAPEARQPALDHPGEPIRMEAHHRKVDLSNDALLRALAREPTERTPVWLMRQAGRYLPEYNAARARAGSFLALARSPALATEVTLQPLERFALDASILFSDILLLPDAMGLGLYFTEGEGPRFERPLRDEVAVRALAAPDPALELGYVLDAVRELRRARRDRLSERPDRGRRAGGDAVRHLGRHARARRLRDVLARVFAPRARGTGKNARGPARAEHPLHQGRRRMAGGDGRERLRRDRTGRCHRSGVGASPGCGPRRAPGQSRFRRVACAARTGAGRGAARARRLRRRARARLQSVSRRSSAHTGRVGCGAGRRSARLQSDAAQLLTYAQNPVPAWFFALSRASPRESWISHCSNGITEPGAPAFSCEPPAPPGT